MFSTGRYLAEVTHQVFRGLEKSKFDVSLWNLFDVHTARFFSLLFGGMIVLYITKYCTGEDFSMFIHIACSLYVMYSRYTSVYFKS